MWCVVREWVYGMWCIVCGVKYVVRSMWYVVCEWVYGIGV